VSKVSSEKRIPGKIICGRCLRSVEIPPDYDLVVNQGRCPECAAYFRQQHETRRDIFKAEIAKLIDKRLKELKLI
jgi:uncharacterized CHY-type Zn-finger protein